MFKKSQSLKYAVIAALVLALALFAQSSSKSVYLPSAEPDRIILTWSGDPATMQSVTFRTEPTNRAGEAEISPAGTGPGFTKAARKVSAQSETIKTNLGEATYHSVTFAGLEPDTLYAYRVGSGGNWSEWSQFRTAQAGAAPLEFIYFGDVQNNIREHWSRVVRTAYRAAPNARFLLYAGDLINNFDQDAQWGEWHQAAGWINSIIPSLPTPGNHEHGKSGLTGSRTLTVNWRPQFTLPQNGVPGLEETNYYIDIHGVRMISLNSNEQLQAQAEWLSGVLKNNPNRWTVATFHHPILSTARNRDNKEVRAAWQPLFDRYGVDLVLTGHDHTYARSGLEKSPRSEDPKAGTVYVVSVSGSKMYELQRQPWMLRAAGNTQLFQVVGIDGDRLSFEARTADGVLYDRFELHKQKNGPNVLVNQTPKTPELRGK